MSARRGNVDDGKAAAPKRRRCVPRLRTLFIFFCLLLVAIEFLVRALGLTSPVQTLVRVDFEGNEYWTPNMHFFTDLHGAEATGGWDARAFMALKDKPQGLTRLVVFGESAAIGEPPDTAYGFWRILEVMLKERFPNRSFEVLPLAYSATDSYCMYEAAQEANKLTPDFFVIYMGNNEVEGPHGVINPFVQLAGENAQVIRVAKMLQRAITLRIGGGVIRMAAQALILRARFDPATVLERMASYDPQGPEVQACVARYRKNLRDMCRAGLACGARVVVCTVATNLRDWSPFYSAHGPNWDPSGEAEWQRLLEDGRRLESEAHYQGAARAYREALTLDTRYAEVHFRLGHCCFELGDMTSAREHYTQAREYDRLQARVGNAINGAARDVVREFATPDVVLADAEKAVAEASPGGIPGWGIFYDYVHLQFPGSYHVARSVFDSIGAMVAAGNPPGAGIAGPACSIAACEERLALTPELRLIHLNAADSGILRDLRKAVNRDWHVDEVNQQRQELRRLIAGADPARQERAYERALELDPNDHVLQARYLRRLMDGGNIKTAYDYAMRVCTAQPPYRPQLLILGELQIKMGFRDEGLATLSKAASLYPDDNELKEAISKARDNAS